jgi:4a-hydroxytetrahydrobiopterin dehydratase
MDEQDPGRTLRRQEASDAVSGLGWRWVVGTLRATVAVGSPAEAAAVAARSVAACGEEAASLSIDLRRDQVALSLQSPASASVTAREVALAQQVSEVTRGLGLATEAGVGGPSRRSVQVVEIAIDALDIAAVRPFWKAVLGYTDEPGRSGPEDPLVDPWARARPSGSSRWMPRVPSATASTWTSRSPTTRLPTASGPRRGARLLGPGRPRGQRGLHHHLAGPRPLGTRQWRAGTPLQPLGGNWSIW